MGNFYTNHTVLSTDQAAVIRALAGRQAYVSPPSQGAIVVFDQEMMDVETLGAHLSGELRCPVLAIMNHDDDILWYALFENGAKTDEYDSTPGYFTGPSGPPEGGDAKKLCAAFGSQNVEEAEKILRKESSEDEYLFAFERHADLVRALDLPDYSVSCGFEYIAQGSVPKGLSIEQLVRVDGR